MVIIKKLFGMVRTMRIWLLMEPMLWEPGKLVYYE